MSRLALAGMVVVLLLGSLVVTSCALFGKKETVVTIAQVPPSVRSAIEKVTAGNTIKSIEKIERNGKVTYEVEYVKDGKELDAYFAEDGTQVKGAQ
jgi:uncharacterized membrane protein YkoI